MPTPGRLNISRCACSKTGTGITAGPALKLKIRSVILNLQVYRITTVIRRSRAGAIDLRLSQSATGEQTARLRSSRDSSIQTQQVASSEPAHAMLYRRHLRD